jgi:hypothetical protein
MRTPLVTLMLVVLTLSLAACGGAAAAPSGVASLESAAPDASATPRPSVDPEEAQLAFAECMRENGIDMPDPGGGGGGALFRVGGPDGVDVETFEAANEACRHHLEAVMGEGGQELTPEQRDAMLAFAQCMREHGIDMPDPGTGGPGGVFIGRAGGGDGPDPNDPEFREAMDACREHLGDAFPGRGGDEAPAPAAPDAQP